MAFYTSPFRKLTRQADSMRDAKNWQAAADLYGAAIAREGNSRKTFRYMIQRGNCLKEAGDYDGALESYNCALKINKEDSDLFLQRGHLFKLLHRTNDAAVSYQQSFNVNPMNKDAKFEIERGGGIAVIRNNKMADNQSAQTIWLDVSDFVAYAKVNVSLSGIQRVIANLVLHLKSFDTENYRIVPVIPEYDRFRILSTSLSSFIELVSIYEEITVRREKIDALLENVYESRTQVYPEKNDIFIVAGAFWIYPHYDCIMHLRQSGVRFGLFIHDLIQIRMPEYVERAATDQFNIQLSDALDIADFILANSQFVAEDIRRYLAETKNYSLPVEAVVLPTELKGTQTEINITNVDIIDVAQTEYVISVSTIEIRKNHRLLIKIWEKLRKEFGENTPKLVFVGKWGWEIDEFRKYVTECGYVGDWLFIFNGISDIEMEFLYKNSLFSIYPSFAEGFGLPIGESLVYGKPCIASNTTSMPEVGGNFVRYIDPFDIEYSYPIIRKPIIDRDDLAEWEEDIRTNFKPKTWSTFCTEFYKAIIKHGTLLGNQGIKANCYLPAMEFISGGSHDILNLARQNSKIITFRSARHHYWHPANHWGAWSQRRRSDIQFISEYSGGQKIHIFLRLHRHSSRESDPVCIIDAGNGESAVRLSEHPTVFRTVGIVTPGGVVNISLNLKGKCTSSHEFIAWSGIAYCLDNDATMLATTYDAIIPVGKPPELVSYIPTTKVSLD